MGLKFVSVLETQPALMHSLHLSRTSKAPPFPVVLKSHLPSMQHFSCDPFMFLTTSHNHTGLDKRCIQVQSTDINLGSILSARSYQQRYVKAVSPGVPAHSAGCHRLSPHLMCYLVQQRAATHRNQKAGV